MAYTDQFSAASDPTLLTRIRMSIINAAIQIQAESTVTINHAARAELALSVLRDSITFSEIFIFAVVTQSITTASTDAAIDIAVNSVWNAMAAAEV